MTTKADIITRRKQLLDQLTSDSFDKEKFLTTHNITDRTLRRDLHAIAEHGEIFENRLNILRKLCIGKLTKKAKDEKLSDSMMLQIVLSGVAQKQEIRTDSTITSKKEVDITVKLRSYEESIRKAVERDFQLHNTKQPIHPTQTDS